MAKINEIYTENIRRLRMAKGLSQSELSEKAGLSEKYLSSIETGRKTGSFETMENLARALDVEPYELLIPSSYEVGYNDKKTKALMKKLKESLISVVDTVEDFLVE